MYSYLVDDQVGGYTSRVEGRIHLDKQLNAPFIVAEPDGTPGTMTKAEFDKMKMDELRENWGRSEEAQAQWR